MSEITFSSEEWAGILNDGTGKAGRFATDDVCDGLERALLRADELIDSAVREYRRRSAQSSPVVERHDDDPRLAMRQLLGQAERSVAIAVSRPADAEALGPPFDVAPGAEVRLLVVPYALGVERARGFLRLPKCEIRVSRSPLQGMVLVDGRIARVWSNSESLDGQASTIRLPAVVQALATLFTASWETGVALPNHPRPGERPTVALVQRILEHLLAGSTDAQSAEKLGISLRTYRRHVASIMHELGAKSRFQAGALAIEAGLFDVRAAARAW